MFVFPRNSRLPNACVVAVLGLSSAAAAQPDAEQILNEMGFSTAEKQQVFKGEYVTSKIGAVSDRDLSFAVAFLVNTSPESLSKQVTTGQLITDDAQVQAYGMLTAPGSLADFAGLKIMSHAFTDQVAGSGGAMKRSIGSKVMAGQMKEIFEKGRKRLEH